ncbi:MAG: ChaN family lipoprotein [Myxococcota bacterium]
MWRLACSALALAAACALPKGEPFDWQAKLGRDDPLAGQILDARTGAAITRDELGGRLRLADFILLGEKHDNPDHHRLQAWVIESLARDGSPPAIAFEMLSEDNRPALVEWRRLYPENLEALGEMLDWKHSGWPPWEIYRPVFAAVVSRQLAIEPANLSKQELAQLHRAGIESIPPERRTALALDPPLAGAARESLVQEIREGHCGVADDGMIAAMIDTQRVRDATLADALIRSPIPAVLIAGAGHVRKDRAVPLYVARRAPERRVISIAFVEVGPDAAARAELARDFDFLWFTPRVDDLDPCDRFREELEKMRPRGEG